MKSPIKAGICLLITIATYFLLTSKGLSNNVVNMSVIVILMASLWVTEAINIYITALLPLILFPFFGIMSMKEISPAYMSHIIFLFIGGFLLAFGLERWNLHKRLSLKIIISLGGSPKRILFSFMLSSYFLSMWILNTATTMMLLPAALAIINQIIKTEDKKFQTGLLLGIAFASSIGGSATLVGTMPNLILSNFVKETSAITQDINFANWMMIGLPLSIVFFFITFFILQKQFIAPTMKKADMSLCKEIQSSMGNMRWQEHVVSFVFVTTVLAWFFRKTITIGSIQIPGWSTLLPLDDKSFIQDGTIAILASIILFLIPSKKDEGGLLKWDDFKKLPIGVIFLFGSGFALSKGITSSGLSLLIQEKMTIIQNIPPFAIMIVLVIFMIFLTEFTSNSASATLMIPIVYEAIKSMDTPSLYFLIPLTIAASFAFMLPVATPPNTLVFATEKIAIKDMVRTGIWLNLIGIVVISLVCNWLVMNIF